MVTCLNNKKCISDIKFMSDTFTADYFAGTMWLPDQFFYYILLIIKLT